MCFQESGKNKLKVIIEESVAGAALELHPGRMRHSDPVVGKDGVKVNIPTPNKQVPPRIYSLSNFVKSIVYMTSVT